jgi:hypothetical protein
MYKMLAEISDGGNSVGVLSPYYIIPAPHIIVSIKLLEEFGKIFTDAFWVNYPLSMNQLEHEISRRVNCKIER